MVVGRIFNDQRLMARQENCDPPRSVRNIRHMARNRKIEVTKFVNVICKSLTMGVLMGVLAPTSGCICSH